MDYDFVLERLKKINHSDSVFSQIMRAETVQQLIDIPVEPDEMLSYFAAVEEYGRIEEDATKCIERMIHKLKEVRPVEKKRRAFFI